jgi:hypothetical protein
MAVVRGGRRARARVAVGPVAQPAVAQQASPTATPWVVNVQYAQPVIRTPTPTVVVTNTNSQSLANAPVPTPVSVATALAAPTPNSLQLGGCSDQLFVDCAINKSNGSTAEGTLQAWAIQSALQLYKLPPTDAPLLMSNARDSLRALILSRLLTASQKSPSEQTPEEAAMVATISGRVKQFKHRRCRGRGSPVPELAAEPVLLPTAAGGACSRRLELLRYESNPAGTHAPALAADL